MCLSIKKQMFKLITDASELRATNEGVSNMNWRLVSASKPVTGNDFAGAPQSFKWSCVGTEYWVPQKTFFRMQYKLTKGDGTTPLTREDHIAPDIDLCAHTMQSAEFRIGGRTVCSINDRIPQVQALKRRMYKSKGQDNFLDSISKTEVDLGARASRLIDNSNYTDFPIDRDAHSDASGNRVITVDHATESTSTRITVHESATGASTAVGATLLARLAAGYVGGYLNFRNATGVCTAPVKILAVKRGNGAGYDVAADGTGAIDAATAIQFTVERCEHLYPTGQQAANTIIISKRSPYESDHTLENRREQEVFWTPPLGIFDVKHAMPAGDYELYLTPKPAADFTKVIESWLTDASKTHGAGQNYRFTVEKFELYVATVQGPRFDSGTFLLDLDAIGCRAERVQSSDDERIVDVAPSTHALTIAYQDDRVLNDTAMSASKFKAYSGDRRLVVSDRLTNLYVQYSGQTYPQPHYAPELSGTKDLMYKLYLDSQLAFNGHQDTGGTESFAEWRQAGPYYHIRTPKDGMDRSTRVNVNHRFNLPADVGGVAQGNNMNCLVFDHYFEVATISVTDGRVTSVTVQKA